MTRVRWTLIGAALLSVSLPLTVGEASSAEGSDTALRTICSEPPNAEVLERSAITSDGYREAERWIASEESQLELSRLHELLESFDDSVVGQSRDHLAEHVIVVVDAAAPLEALDELRLQIEQADISLSIEIRMSCRPEAEILADLDTVARLAESDLDGRDAIAYWADAATSGVIVAVSNDVLAERARAVLNDRPFIDIGVAQELSRAVGGRGNDSSPHYGDARIVSTMGACSSNFSYVSLIFGNRMSATAGHCRLYGSTWQSGPHAYGTIGTYFFPDPDIANLAGVLQSYTNVVYTTPCCPSQRNVIGKMTPGVDSYVCVGGQVTEAECGIQVISVNQQFCDISGCTNGLYITASNTVNHVDQGDSGGVVYQRSGSNGALAAGLIVAEGQLWGYHLGWHHTIGQVESALWAALLVTP